ncbi:hypothetical protein Patl1_30691 [Pistacia atlantica]|uniref:Uncharacterized protein n=1 Tax=Pistacia atlantica TaxID=434234 RepID=A0ACC1AFF9_9ROSI|nr:hypothetical protein Patl1_30691 [Pistacia atlantica]
MAAYSKKEHLVLRLLDELPEHYLDKMTHQNNAGNTILHDTATSNHSLRAADKVLKKAPGLLGMRNNNGETALLRARYGKTNIFNFHAKWRVKEVTISHFMNHWNDSGLTAEGFFAVANFELRVSSKEWLKHTAEGCSVLSVLIATVAFAAAYTVPGGSN